jgi:hypothetical protein
VAYDLQIGASTVFMEAASEPQIGKLGVAYSLVNRLKDARKRYGFTIADVCLMPEQYSSWNTSATTRRLLGRARESDPAFLACLQAMQAAMDGTEPDPTLGATLYYAVWLPKPPYWVGKPGINFTVQLGQQKFFTAT